MPAEGITDERVEQAVRQSAREARRAERFLGVEVQDISQMIARVDAGGPVRYLVDPLWPADAYGVIAARDKAGKTWAAVDLALSVATGGSWFGRFPCVQGPVLMYSGEGGARNIVRRVRAVCEQKGVQEGLLTGHLRVGEQAPELRKDRAIEQLDEELLLFHPALVIIDPLYLAAIGGRGSDLYAMGELLTDVQQTCQSARAALLFTHHWNKTGEGTGAQRMTGVGPGAWGRVLGSGSVERVTRDGQKETVEVEWEFTGSEIPGTTFTMTRTVWADDPHDLSSPLHYEVEAVGGLARLLHIAERQLEQRDQLLAFLAEHPRSSGNAVEQVQGRVGRDLLRELEAEGLVRWELGPRRAKLWSAVS